MSLFGKKEKPLTLNTLVIDLEKGFDLEHIKKPEGPKWLYGDRYVHLMVRHADDKLAVLMAPQGMDEPPERLYRALHWDEIVKPLFGKKSDWLEKLKIGLLVGLFVGILFFIFLILSSMGVI